MTTATQINANADELGLNPEETLALIVTDEESDDQDVLDALGLPEDEETEDEEEPASYSATKTTQALTKANNLALLNSVYGAVNNALTFTVKIKSTDKNGKDKVTKKKVTLTCDTTIGDYANGKLYDFTVNAYIGAGTPKKVLGLTLDYDGQIDTFCNHQSIVANDYTIDGYSDNVLLNVLAIDLLSGLGLLNDGPINLFFDLLRLNGFEFDKTSDGLPILTKVKLDQIKILELFVKNGANARKGSPLQVISEQCKGLLPKA